MRYWRRPGDARRSATNMMRIFRFRIPVRTLLIAIAVLAAFLALALRFGPHVVWQTVHSDIASGVLPIPSSPLIVSPPAEDIATCDVGPLSLAIPKSLCNAVEIHHGIGGAYLLFHDNERSIALELPKLDDRMLQEEIAGFPDKARLTFPRLYTEIAAAKSSDFSFGMTHRQLRWHKWLLTCRSQIGSDVASVEYVRRPDIEGNLLSFRAVRTFQWSTVDCKWEGAIYFKCASPDDLDWIRYACATFVINGNPNVFNGCDDAAIKSMIRIRESDNSTNCQPSANRG